ncbi:MAG: ABC transporter ATP-binding protein [bacterium]|nr:ABC transporter ATP-binding protein [bacterium]
MKENAILTIENLTTEFVSDLGSVKAVDDVSFSVAAGEITGIVGESGCGKSVTALSIMRLVPAPSGKITTGKIIFNGVDLRRLTEKQMRKIRGNQISMIFQEPMSSLNPVFTIGYQITETIRLHQQLKKKVALEKAVEMLRIVGISSPEKRISEYPHELSGGMKQRVMIAIALSCNPKLLIADEPTTALDVTIQAQILDLMQQMNRDFKTAILLITHDLGVIAELVEKVIVMYAGKIMEQAAVESIFNQPEHPYTLGLMGSLPNPANKTQRKTPLKIIPGIVPSLLDLPDGCKFSPRCAKAMPRCRHHEPPLFKINNNHYSRCWLNENQFSSDNRIIAG